jgi:hypothetical protein
MLTAGSVVSSATAFRVGVSCLELVVKRTPPLARLAVSASLGGGDMRKAQGAFRDDLLALARDSAEVSWRELRRGVDELDAFTRSDEAAHGERPHRPYRVKL